MFYTQSYFAQYLAILLSRDPAGSLMTCNCKNSQAVAKTLARSGIYFVVGNIASNNLCKVKLTILRTCGEYKNTSKLNLANMWDPYPQTSNQC